ncbi:MAG: phosphopantetheine-binding protein [Bacteroidia bacterium]|nr:phosphopantetheine-binding protein [Bacteroidia bacterium]
MEDFKEKFNAVLTNKLNINWEDLKPEARFSDLGLNSLDMVELIIEFEKAFHLTISDDDIDKIITVGDVEGYLKTRLNIN